VFDSCVAEQKKQSQPKKGQKGKLVNADPGLAMGSTQETKQSLPGPPKVPSGPAPSVFAVAGSLMRTQQSVIVERVTVFPCQTPSMAAAFVALAAPGTLVYEGAHSPP